MNKQDRELFAKLERKIDDKFREQRKMQIEFALQAIGLTFLIFGATIFITVSVSWFGQSYGPLLSSIIAMIGGFSFIHWNERLTNKILQYERKKK